MRFKNENIATPVPKVLISSLLGKTVGSYWTTDYKWKANTIAEIKFTKNVHQSSWATLFGARSSGSDTGYNNGTINVYIEKSVDNFAGTYNGTNSGYLTTYSLGTEYTVKFGKGEYYINGNLEKTYSSSAYSPINYSIWISGLNQAGSQADESLRAEIQYFKIWEDDVLVRDYRPAGNLNFICRLTGAVGTLVGEAEYKQNVGNNRIIVTDVEPAFTGLSFVSSGNSTISFSNASLNLTYKINDGNWVNYDTVNTIQLANNDTIKFKRNSTTDVTNAIGRFTMTGSLAASGNIMSLLSSSYENMTTLYNRGNIFYNMFLNCTALTAAPVLPATTLSSRCYQGMFYGCTGLTTAPALPATNLADYCYLEMFQGCTGLTTAPALPATNMWFNCYGSMFRECTGLTTAPVLNHIIVVWDRCFANMFYGCTGLTTAPALPSGLADYCYDGMFAHCTGLTTAPELVKRNNLVDGCYSNMFGYCTGLTTAPELTATILRPNCYNSMFQHCTGITEAPELPATDLAVDCYAGMFIGCTGLTKAPDLKAEKLVDGCYYRMFEGCSNLDYIICLANQGFDSSLCTTNWVQDVSTGGSFFRTTGVQEWQTGKNGIPANWDVFDV